MNDIKANKQFKYNVALASILSNCCGYSICTCIYQYSVASSKSYIVSQLYIQSFIESNTLPVQPSSPLTGNL